LTAGAACGLSKRGLQLNAGVVLTSLVFTNKAVAIWSPARACPCPWRPSCLGSGLRFHHLIVGILPHPRAATALLRQSKRSNTSPYIATALKPCHHSKHRTVSRFNSITAGCESRSFGATGSRGMHLLSVCVRSSKHQDGCRPTNCGAGGRAALDARCTRKIW
jgi:hypothetical protein